MRRRCTDWNARTRRDSFRRVAHRGAVWGRVCVWTLEASGGWWWWVFAYTSNTYVRTGYLVSCRQETADAKLHLDGRANANALSKEAGRSDLCCAGFLLIFSSSLGLQPQRASSLQRQSGPVSVQIHACVGTQSTESIPAISSTMCWLGCNLTQRPAIRLLVQYVLDSPNC